MYDIKGQGRTRQEPVAVGMGVMRYVPEYGSNTKIEVLVHNSIAELKINDVLAEIDRHWHVINWKDICI